MSLAVPGEWAPHSAMWLGFPSHEDLWQDNLEPARREVADLARALAGPGEAMRITCKGAPRVLVIEASRRAASS